MFGTTHKNMQYDNSKHTYKMFTSCGGSAEHNILGARDEHTRSHLRTHHTSSSTNAKLRVIPYTCHILHVSQLNYSTSKCKH